MTTVLAVQVAVASASRDARTAPRRIVSSLSVTGEIQRLGPSKIAVGRIGCTIPAKLTVSAGRFVVGDPVRIACRNGTLRSVKYSPELAAAQSDAPSAWSPPTIAPAPQRPFDPSTAKSTAYSVGTIVLGGSPTGDTSTATGPITDLSDGSLTAGGLTCSFKPFFDTFFGQVMKVGDNVTLTCTGGVFVHLASVGTITRS